ncbi:RND family efflux transporter, MFP subunit [Bryocella elongata]|uniref:RND family efflux transporter, MFP subunit n=1 Tax=Bryocella elongata TaxID=863522 RepID=A0A1H6BK10_9BACT|nr:efflux RND transporter periplasmic adaptor subunit [Bryocella elongata]SEG61004.1 RND family efflux transporter, MFP subunit [Bryocella elongata]
MPDDLKPNDHRDNRDERTVGESFADPNAQDDIRLGKSFEATNASRKPKHAREEHPQEPGSRRILWIGIAVAVVIFIGALLLGGLPRLARDRELQKDASAEKHDKPVVVAERVDAARTGAALVLPGTTIPLTEAYVYARSNGYLKTRYVDIGDHVKKGQLLAVIEAPDLDAQVDQARQQLRQAEQQLDNQKSQLDLQKVTLDRYRVLVTKGVFSRQVGDQQETNYATQVANVAAAQRNVQAFKANLDRNISLQAYEQVRAPFTGIITQRNVDVGALISASGGSSGAASGPAPTGQFSTTGGSEQAGQSNNSGASGSIGTAATPAQSPGQGGPLFGMADQSRLRILISVPEGYATAIHPGAVGKLAVQEYPNASFTGVITRTSNSIDPNTRTLLTEVQVDNKDGKLLPGMYSTVTFPPTAGVQGPLTILGDAIIVRQNTTTVAKIVNGRVHFTPVTLGRDFGDVVEIVSGLQQGDIIVISVTDDVTEGREVEARIQSATNQSEGGNNSTSPKASNAPKAQSNGSGEKQSGGQR